MNTSVEVDLLLTIAIPTYNNCATLDVAIESCLKQSDLKMCEILVVDNASTDQTTEVVNKYLHHDALRYVRNDITLTMFENHNVCLNRANGRYVLFCHSDDILDEDAVLILKEQFVKRGYPKRYACWGYSLFRDYSPMLIDNGIRPGELFAGERAVVPFLMRGVTPSGTCYSKDMLEYGGFVNSTHRLAPSDSSTMVFLALKGFRFEMIQQIVCFRTEASTAVKNNNDNKEPLLAYSDTYLYLKSRLDDDVFARLISTALTSTQMPISFLYFLSSIMPKKVIRSMAKYGSFLNCVGNP